MTYTTIGNDKHTKNLPAGFPAASSLPRLDRTIDLARELLGPEAQHLQSNNETLNPFLALCRNVVYPYRLITFDDIQRVGGIVRRRFGNRYYSVLEIYFQDYANDKERRPWRILYDNESRCGIILGCDYDRLHNAYKDLTEHLPEERAFESKWIRDIFALVCRLVLRDSGTEVPAL